MKGFFGRINPTVRGLAIVALVALVVVVLRLEATLAALTILLRVAFLLAIAFFVFLVWREQRGHIALWPARARVAFYGAAALIVADLGVNWYYGARGGEIVAFVAVIVICAVAMWRIWRDQHTYGV